MLRTLFRSIIALVICGVITWQQTPLAGLASAVTPDSSWIHPASPALHNVGPITDLSLERYTSCTQLTYRQVDDLSKKMRTGCFVRTAFGLYDSASSMAIFTGTDEAIPLYYNGQTAALRPMPNSSNMLRFSGAPTLGAYAYLYTHLPAVLQTNKMWPSLWRYKEITAVPTVALTDDSGRLLKVNTSAMGFSARSQWMVVDSPSRALVRVNLANHALLPFDSSLYRDGSPLASHHAAMAITEDGRYAAVVSKEHQFFRVYDLSSCSGDASVDRLTPLACPYYDYWDYVSQQVTGNILSVIHLSFLHDNLLSFAVNSPGGVERYVLTPNGPITSLIPYLGMGDSFASGQGTFNYLSGTDTDDNRCHLSIHSYPLLLNDAAFSSGGQSVACSGARIHDIGNTAMGYSGQAKSQQSAASRQADGSEATILQAFTPGYLAQQRFVTSYQPGTITVQIGGNDSGFGSILLRCVSPIASVKPFTLNTNDCYSSYEDRLEVMQLIDRTHRQWVALFKQLRQTSPLSHVYVVGYPHIVSAKGDCSLNTPLTLEDIAFARELTQYLNEVIQQAARASGVHYLNISDALTGYELCSGNTALPAVNGVTAGTDNWILGQESFHPNTLGHELIAQKILKLTDNFAATQQPTAIPNAASPSVAPTHPALAAPLSGRPVRFLHPAQVANHRFAVRGSTVALHLTGADYFIRPNSTAVVAINGVPVHTGKTTETGDFQTTVTIPPDTPLGTGIIDITVPNQNDETIAIQDDLPITDSPNDHDGDGLPNDQDSCPTTPSTGVDADSDGIDDACDSYTHLEPTPQPSDPGPNSIPPTSTQSPQPSTPVAPGQPGTTLQPTAVTTAFVPSSSRLPRLQNAAAPLQNKSMLYSPSAPTVKTIKPNQQQPSSPLLADAVAKMPWPALPQFAWWWLVLGAVMIVTIERGLAWYSRSRSLSIQR